MRDSRFPGQSTVWRELIAQGRLVDGEIWLNPLVEYLYLALRQARCFEEGEKLSSLKPSLSEQLIALRSSGITVPEQIIIALDSSFDSRAEDTITAQAAWCWGLALGRCALEVKTSWDLRNLLEKGSHDCVMLEAFLEHTARLLYDQHPAIVTAIEESIAIFIKDPGSFILGGRGGGYSELLDHWRKKPPSEAFDLKMLGYLPLHYEFLGLIEQVRKIDRTAYLIWLDRLANPLLVDDAFSISEVFEDFDELLALLKSAQPAYEDLQYDRWISLTAPILLEAALRHAQTLLVPFARAERDEESYNQLCNDLSERMERLAKTLALRNDGSKLAAHWLMRLVRIKTQLNEWLSLPASMAIEALVRVFGDSERNAAGVIQWLPSITKLSADEEKELRLSGLGLASANLTPGTDILMVRLLMKAFRDDPKNFNDELHAFSNLLLVRDAGLFTDPSLSELGTWRHRLVGHALAGPDLVSRWKKHWNALEEQRRRNRHFAFTSDHSADEPSLFLCATALCLLERDGKVVSTSEPESLELWNAVYESVWFMTLLYNFQHEGEVWRYLLTLLMRVLPRHLDIESEAGIDRMEELLASFAGDEELVLHSVARLFLAGCSPKLLMRALTRTSLELESILDRFEPYSNDVAIYPMTKRWHDAASICREFAKNTVRSENLFSS